MTTGDNLPALCARVFDRLVGTGQSAAATGATKLEDMH